MSTELFDVLDRHGKPVGTQKTRNQILEDGDWRLVTHAWLVNGNYEVLCQQRARKGMWDDLWDVTVGGGVATKEPSRQACARELGEELGLTVDPNELQYVDRFETTKLLPERGIDSREFSDTYIFRREVNIANLALQKAEVTAVAWVPLEAVGIETAERVWVPHPSTYYSAVRRACQELK